MNDSSSEESEHRAPSTPRQRVQLQETRWERTKSNLLTITGAVLLALFIRIVLFEPFEIEGPSMEPTLLNGDRVVVAKVMYGLFLPFMNHAVLNWGLPHLGDVIIVHSPADNIDIVKRVVAVPGDTIWMRNNILYRDGHPVPTKLLGPCAKAPGSTVDKSPYEHCIWVQEKAGGVTYKTSRDAAAEMEDTPHIKVPPGHVFVMGDHRDRSNDSRNPMVGPIPGNRIKGKALFIYWSSWRNAGESWVANLAHIRWHRIFEGVP